MSIININTGYTKQLDRIIDVKGDIRVVPIPTQVFLIDHPQGPILLDTGYANRFIDETKKLPFALYRKITPVHNIRSAKETLEHHNIKTTDIATVLLSHFHADHIAGLKDFPNTKIISSKEGFDTVKNLKGYQAIKKAFIPNLLPSNIEERISFIENHEISLPQAYYPFTKGFDILGDGTMLGVYLPGHATGQIGIFYEDTFIIADACWKSEHYINNRMPSLLTKPIQEDWQAYKQTINKIHQLYKNNSSINILLTHQEK